MSSPSLRAPSDAPKSLRSRAHAVLQRLRGGELTPRRLALSVAMGLFIGCTPFYGLHLWITAPLAVFFHLDFFVAYLAANISIPPLIPVILFAEVQIGTWLLEGHFLPISTDSLSVDHAWDLGMALGVGTLVLGTTLAVVGGYLAWLISARALARRAE